jgi:hypothetical protein
LIHVFQMHLCNLCNSIFAANIETTFIKWKDMRVVHWVRKPKQLERFNLLQFGV